ncbi:MAG: 2-oxoglutarate dehydrogenase E1 component [Chloroflexota bacterium]
MDSQRDFHGPNFGYLVELYDRYVQDPNAVDEATRNYFAQRQPSTVAISTMRSLPDEKIVGAVDLAHAIRGYGHLAARLDPLGREAVGDPLLEPASHGLSDDDLRHLPASVVGGPVATNASDALDAIQRLRAIYSFTTGYDYDHVRAPAERDWLRYAAESGRFRPPQQPINDLALLERLTQVETFEQFLQRIFPGKTRFSLEGLDLLVPMLDEIIGAAVEGGIRSVLIGMAHRGRLNVLAHVLNMPYAHIMAAFKDARHNNNPHADLGWTGDVRYHSGARRAVKAGDPMDVVINMAPNPSHLEFVNPVIVGMARAAGTSTSQPGAPRFDHSVSLPILIHGDAALPGQGVVAETLNLSRLDGYQTGGTLHIIANNQLGYTTNPHDARSTLYASDLAKGFEMPVVHVNADDPVACVAAARMAFAYRAQFHKDFFIDLIGYRRWGHNEGDEPTFTQPTMYALIEKQPTVRAQWAAALVARGEAAADQPQQLVDARMKQLQSVLDALRPEDSAEPLPEPPPPGAARRVTTRVPLPRLRELNDALLRVPSTFALNPKLERAMQRRRNIFDKPDEPTVDWATAEHLALASILEDGIAIRLTGEDVERGTFGQRHAVFHDVRDDTTFTPLQALPQARAAFEIHDSALTESAAVGFEYGYNVQESARLVIWEAQYGDFINGAQVIVDEFIASARAKWGQTPSLVLLLPHGSEGAGPDHSSARLERFLNLCAELNMRVANCTTAAQYFHLLRRQALLLKTDPLPLVLLTPKSLLRHPLARSTPRELADGFWQPVLDDPTAQAAPVRRLILCNGKVYVDLVSHPQRAQHGEVAIVRVEQLYRWPTDDLQAMLDKYCAMDEVVWLQEEPENMGAWPFVQPNLNALLDGLKPLRFIGRRANSSPAEGSAAWFAANQKMIVESAFSG